MDTNFKKKVGYLVLSRDQKLVKRGGRKTFYFDLPSAYLGFKYILNEIDRTKYTVAPCNDKTISGFDYILVSLHSQYDVLNLLAFIKKNRSKIKGKVVIGGKGVINIRPYRKYIDVAVWGRAEGQINKILAGEEQGNVWCKEHDPDFKGKYKIRQFQYFVEGENSVGCQYKCTFCYYSWINKRYHIKNGKYGVSMIAGYEDHFKHFIPRGGHEVTAIDGVTEETRRRVKKGLSNQDIVDALDRCFKKKDKISLKIYNICGYPWEIPKTDYFREVVDVLIQGTQGRPAILSFLFTPFIAMPFTPLEYSTVDLDIDWRKFLYGNPHLDPNIPYEFKQTKIYVLPYILSVYKRWVYYFLNRATEEDAYIFDIILNSRFQRFSDAQKVIYLKKQGIWNKFFSLQKSPCFNIEPPFDIKKWIDP